MTRYRHPRIDALRGGRSAARTDSPWTERVLQTLGAHPTFTDALLGDLAEECARRVEQGSPLAARWWYLREAFRSAPHLVWNAVRHGGARGRARAAAVLMAVALVPTAALIALALRDGPPARLVVDGQRGADVSDGILLNTRRPVQLATRALDADGRPLRSAKVRYRWLAGIPVSVTPSGVVRCWNPGDATVRASIGTVETTLLLRCRPVKQVRAEWGIDLVVGDSGHDLAFTALAPDGRPVSQLTGELLVGDSTIATLKGNRIRPVAPGYTRVIVRIGDGESSTGVSVFEPVRTLAGLRPDQRMVVVPVQLARGDTVHWPLPKGLFWIRYEGAPDAQAIPAFAVDGPVMCMPDFGPTVDQVGCLARGPGAVLRITHPVAARGDVAGRLVLWRNEDPQVPIPVPLPRSRP